MKQLKESFITKKNINFVSSNKKEIWVIISPDQEEEYKIEKAGWTGDRFETLDGVICYPFLKDDPILKKLDLTDDITGISITKKKMTYQQVINLICNLEYYNNYLTWHTYFEDELRLDDVLESFITKNNIKNVGFDTLYLVNPFNEYYISARKKFKDKEIISITNDTFILTKNDIIWLIKNTKRDSKNYGRYTLDEVLYIYPLTGLKKDDIELLKDELSSGDVALENIIASYGLVQIDPYEFK